MAEQEMTVEDLWLWPATEGVRCWTKKETHSLALRTPWASAAPPAIHALRDRGERLDLRAALAEPLSGLVVDLLGRAERLRLHLGQGLPAGWQEAPFEWLTFEGSSLFGRLVIERESPILFEPCPPVPANRPIAVLNLLDPAEPIQPADALADGSVLIYDGLAASEQMLAETDLRGLAALIVIAHGTECDEAHPFRLPDGRSWALPVERGLPPLVILMACGTDTGNLVVDGRRLLEAGARTVLAPIGRPCPQAAGAFLAELIQGWRLGERVDALLAEAQRSAGAERGARLLRLVGRGDLRSDGTARLDELSDSALVARVQKGERGALVTLIDRLTLRALQQEAELDQAEQELRQLLGIGRDNESGERWLGEQLAAIGPSLWPLSRAWTLPLEILLAEAYDHRRLLTLERQAASFQAQGMLPAPFRHYRAKLYYRTGRYALALQEVALGLSRLQAAELCQRGLGLVGHLVSLLIDIDLPGPAAVLSQRLDDCLAQQGGGQVAWERHKLRDRLARIALRQGQSERALALYRLKRAEAIHFGGNGRRELAWLLYIASWRAPQSAVRLAQEVATWLESGWGEISDPGNADALYLIRAYAAWAWRSGQGSALARLIELLPVLDERLFNGDAGPPGFALAYLHLAQRDGMVPEGSSLLPWDQVAAVLEEQRYFLELAAFESLLGNCERALGLLERFDAQRRWVAPAPLALPAWFGGSLLTDWASLVAERAAFERAVLGQQGLSPAALVSSGLLPL